MISDYTTESILKMKQHPWYSEFIAQGVVDFAVVDCESSDLVLLFLFFYPRLLLNWPTRSLLRRQ